jgi:cell division septation protein DedD
LGQIIDPDKAKDWLERTYGIKSERVVEATPDDLVTIRTIESRPPSDFRVIAHFENFTPPDPLTPPSSDREYLINCPSRRFHVDRIESFSEHGARGGQSTSFGPTVWGLAVPNSPDEGIISAVCGPSAAEIALQAARQQAAASSFADQARAPAQRPAPKLAVQAKPKPPATSAAQAQKSSPPTRKPPIATPLTRVQLFAGLDRDMAQRFIEALPARLPALASVGRPEIVQGASGGLTVYRVQIAGFASRAEAVRFCSTAKAAGQDCFVPPQTGH